MSRHVVRGESAPPPEPEPVDLERRRRFKKAMSIAKSPGVALSDSDRYDLARVVPTVDAHGDGSWKNLSVAQLDMLLNMLEGYVFITYLKEAY